MDLSKLPLHMTLSDYFASLAASGLEMEVRVALVNMGQHRQREPRSPWTWPLISLIALLVDRDGGDHRGGDPRMSDSQFYMGEVARLAIVLANAEESPNAATTEGIRKAYRIALQKYTNPFNVNKYQR